jgi:hypothetical protein
MAKKKWLPKGSWVSKMYWKGIMRGLYVSAQKYGSSFGKRRFRRYR